MHFDNLFKIAILSQTKTTVDKVLYYSHLQIIGSKAKINYTKVFWIESLMFCIAYFDALTSNKLSTYIAKMISFLQIYKHLHKLDKIYN